MRCWYLGAQNDGLFIIDQPPRPSTDDEVHDRGVNVIAAVTDRRWAQSIIDAHNAVVTDNELYYLRSILGHLREVQQSLQSGPTLGGEALADNIDWLDCFIDKKQRILMTRQAK